MPILTRYIFFSHLPTNLCKSICYHVVQRTPPKSTLDTQKNSTQTQNTIHYEHLNMHLILFKMNLCTFSTSQVIPIEEYTTARHIWVPFAGCYLFLQQSKPNIWPNTYWRLLMKQVLQHLRHGQLEVADVPTPRLKKRCVLIKTRVSLISAGTERMLVNFGNANLLEKARSQPEKVKQVLAKLQTDGVLRTAEAVLRKLDQPLPLGYSNAGVVVQVGEGVTDIEVGDRVASNGHHAEFVCVPRHLIAKIPEHVSDEQAAFTTLGSIALQGLRLAQPTFGETFMVFGVGLLGLLTVQLLRANGCEVIAVDLHKDRLKLAATFGAHTVNIGEEEDPVTTAHLLTQAHGVDGVMITASAETDEIVHQAASACRKRGRIILVGAVGLSLQRSDFYEKELTFQVSCSYGPGRYDDAYELQGQDYPLGHVRWTEQRNFEAILASMAKGQLKLNPLITHRYDIHKAEDAYKQLRHASDALGMLLTYPQETTAETPELLYPAHAQAAGRETTRISLVGAGQFALGVLLPELQKTTAQLDAVVDSKSHTAQHAARKFKACRAMTDPDALLHDPYVDAILYATGHHAHAKQVCGALSAGKHVFVEKPLALNEQELQEVVQHALAAPQQIVMVGFNRRFSPHTQRIKQALRHRKGALCMQITVNAGHIPSDHWTQDPNRGGGRIIGEACHFIDLMTYLADSPITCVSAMMIGDGAELREDKMSINLHMADGSIGTLHYFSNGSKLFPKEQLELFFDQKVIKMDNFRKTKAYGVPSFRTLRTLKQEKGHKEELQAFVQVLQRGGTSPIPLPQLVNVTRASFAALQSAKERRFIDIAQTLTIPEMTTPTHTQRTETEPYSPLHP